MKYRFGIAWRMGLSLAVVGVLASGLTVSEGEIRSKIDELASIAREQIRAGE